MSPRPIKVVHVISPVRQGGGESLLRALLQQPEVQSLVAIHYRSAEFEAALDESGVRWLALTNRTLGHGASRLRSLALALLSVTAIARLKRLLREHTPDVVHVHSFPASFAVALLTRLGWLRVPALLTRHSLQASHGRLARHLYAWMMAQYRLVTTVSEASREDMRRQFGDLDIRVVHNCVAEAFFSIAPPQHASGRAVFLQIGRFTPSKNQHLVVRTIAQLPLEERHAISVWFVGAGETEPMVRSLAAELGLDSQDIRFLGFVPHEALPAIVAEAHFGLFTSVSEGFGIGAAECLAAGRPVLALDTRVMREVVDGGGLCVPEEALASGLRALRASGTTLSVAARESAARFRSERTRSAYLSLYREAIGVPR